MRLESFKLKVPTSPGSGEPQAVRDIREKYIQIGGGAWTATLRVEVTLNGAEYFKSGGDISAPGIFAIPEPALYVRVTTVNITNGAPTATLLGYNIQS